ncbi:hypothetical protein K2X05_05215 [bacterium]|nr:hypothetical protein [bacterium]
MLKQKVFDLKTATNIDNSREVSHFGSQSGQAILEYILVLVVVVGIALGVMYQLNTALKKYVQSYFGDYVACLLETGEMPSLGGGSGINSDVCASSYEPFSLKNGRPLIAGDGSGSSSSGRSASRRGSTSSRNGARATNNGSALNADRNRGNQAVAASVSKKSKNQTQSYGGGEDASSSYRLRGSGGGAGSRVVTNIKNEKKVETTKKIDLRGKLVSRSPRKIAVDMNNFKPKKQTSDTGFGLSFGDYIRYLIILALIVVIVIFFGGQLLQLRKSWDNNN